jgi:hypothetical protein
MARQVLNDFRGSSLAALVMFTDGVTTEGEDLVQVSKYAAQMKVPLFFVGLGDAHESRDLILHDLEVADTVFVNDTLVFNLHITGQGYGDRSVPVRLFEKGKTQPIATENVKLDPAGKPVKVRFDHKPAEAGEKTFIIDTPVLEDEVEKENNRLERTVLVSEAKLIKVLYIEGSARWEFRYLKTLLERETARKGNKSIDLKVLLLDADAEYAAQDKSALPEFPIKADLNQFDVVILGDVDPKPRNDPKMTEHFKDLAAFVSERGGGLLLIAGEQFAPHAYKDSPLRDILPIDVTAEKQPAEPERGRTESYRPELTPVGRMHPIFSFNERDNEKVWNGLREMYWWSEGYQPKRAAEVLAVHPKVQSGKGKNAQHPLVVQQFIGAGRSLFFGFNETWRWRWREDELRYNQFWIQTIRYLARSRQGRVELRLDKQTPYRRGEPIKITVRFPDDAPAPAHDTDVRVAIERKPLRDAGEHEAMTVKLARVEGSRATYEGLLTRTPEGRYEFQLSQPAVTGPRPRAECKVLAPPGEREQLRMNQPDLERAARESGGKFYALDEAERLPDELPGGTRVSLHAPGPPWLVWNQPLLYVIALLFLGSEWIIRKQRHLL